MSASFSVLSLNAWGTRHWQARQPIITDLLQRWRPDLLCLQEAPETVVDTAAAALPQAQASDTTDCEIAIIFNPERFELCEQGRQPLPGGARARPLVWVRLHDRDAGRELFVGSLHFTWPGHPDEADSGNSPRVAQAQAVRQAVAELRREAAVILAGDCNESVHPRRIFAEVGLVDSPTRLGLTHQPTRPAIPWDDRPPEVDDWIFSCDRLHAVAASVVEHRLDKLPASDHWPVHSCFIHRADEASARA